MANCLACKMGGLSIKAKKPSRQVTLPPNMLALIAKSLSPRTAAALAMTGRMGRIAAEPRLAPGRRLVQIKRMRMGYRSMTGRKRNRSPTIRGVPRGAPAAKKAKR